MDKIFFTDWQSIIRILIISILSYPTLILILRISGKRTLSKMNAFDLIITIALGSTLATVILNKNVSLAEGVIAFALLVAFQFIITYLSSRSKKISQIVKSSPTLLAYKGELIKANMLLERIDEDEIWASLRENDFSALEDVDAIVLETNGRLTVISKVQNPNAQPMKMLVKQYHNK